MSGRLTLNPLKHLDPVGSVWLPLILILFGSRFVIGWARPVPYNPDNLQDKRWGTLYVALAGIVANLIIAIFFGLVIRVAPLLFHMPLSVSTIAFYHILTIIVMVNLVLALFNLIPIPPLDGSKILFSFIPYRYRYLTNILEQWGTLLLLLFIIFLWAKVTPVVSVVFSLITGVR